MAYCPKCKGEMSATAVVCPHCGYDFPNVTPAGPQPKDGIAYTPLADLALIISTIAGVVGCCGAVFAMILLLFSGQFFTAIVVAPIAFFLQLGMVVVFLRVQRW